MLFALFLTVVGGGVGGLLALGTLWATISRYIERSVARSLASDVARDAAQNAVRVKIQSGLDKAQWIVDSLRKDLPSLESSRILAVGGASQLDLIALLVKQAKQVEVVDGEIAINYLQESYAKRDEPSENILTWQAESLDERMLDSVSHEKRYDLVLVVELIHVFPRARWPAVIGTWAKLLHENGGCVLVVFEDDPLSSLAEAGLLQGLFHRVSPAQLRVVLESCGLTPFQTFSFENRKAILASKRLQAIQEAKTACDE